MAHQQSNSHKQTLAPSGVKPWLVVSCAALGCILYAHLALLGEKFLPLWQMALLLNTIFGLCAFRWIYKKASLTRHPVAYLPALSITVAALTACCISRFWGIPTTQLLGSLHVWAVTLIPIAEEWTFRGGVGRILNRYLSPLSAMYLSALIFALIHSHPTIPRIIDGQVGIPLGPFLLGLGTHALYTYTGKVRYGLALHVACNATVPIFALLDARWLQWLHILYGL